MGLGIPALNMKIMLESNPLKPTMLVGRLGVCLKHKVLLCIRIDESYLYTIDYFKCYVYISLYL